MIKENYLRRFSKMTNGLLALLVSVLSGCATPGGTATQLENKGRDPDRLLVVDCLLPGQVRRLGSRLTYMTPRRPIKTSAGQCEIRGGEYVAYDRANFASSLKIWLPQAQRGDAEAQTYVGEIYEKGLGIDADYPLAAAWYRKAAEQGYARAQINLGYLFESGLGVSRDLTQAMNWYRKASGISDGELEYVSSAENVRRISAAKNLVDLREKVAKLQNELQQKQSQMVTQRDTVEALRVEVENQRNAAVAAAAENSVAQKKALAIPGKILSKISNLKIELETARYEQVRLTEKLRDQQLQTLDARAKYSTANRELSEKQETQRRLEKELKSVEAQLAAANSEDVVNRLKKQVEQITALLAQQQGDIKSLIASQSEQSAALQAKVSQAEQTELSLKRELDTRNEAVSLLQIQLVEQRQRYQVDIAALEERLKVAGSEQDTLVGQLSTAQLSLVELQDQRLQLGQDLDQLTRARDIAAAEQLRLSQQLAQLQTTNLLESTEKARLIEELSNSESALFTSQQEQQRLQDKLLDLELALLQNQKDTSASSAGLERVISEREQTVELQQLEIARLRDEIVAARNALAITVAPAEINALKKQLEARVQALSFAQGEQQRLSAKLMDVQLENAMSDTENAARLAELEAKLRDSELQLAQQQLELENLEGEVTQAKSQETNVDADKVAAVVSAGPSIEIIEPPQRITRGLPSLPWQTRNQTMDIIGKVSPSKEVLSLKINDQLQKLNDSGVFTYSHNRSDGSSLNIVAVTQTGDREQVDFEFALPTSVSEPVGVVGGPIKSRPASVPGVNFGNYHAVIIGNYDYPKLTNLETAENDARRLDQLLRTKYGFKTRLLLNANKSTLLGELNSLRETLTSKDNLIIYYAGHGELDENSDRGYWLPVDASPAENGNWVSNKSITDTIDAIKAKHVLVVADSCYSGTLTRTAVPRREQQLSAELTTRWYKVVSNSRVRVVLSSGGVKPVYDRIGNSEHSLFAQALIDELESNNGVLEAYDLYTIVQQKVIAEAQANDVEQNPQYAPIKHAGHEAGEFFFLPVQTVSKRDSLNVQAVIAASGSQRQVQIQSLLNEL